MKLWDLEKGTILSMETRYNNQKMNYEIEIVERFDTSVLIEAIRNEEGKLLDFSSPNLFIDLVLSVDGDKPLIWRHVKMRCVTYRKKVYNQIISDRDGVSFNRRDAVRIYAGVDGKAQVGEHKAGLDVIVKDVSYTGFSIVSEKNIEDVIDKSVRLVFDDERLHLDLRAFVVRKEELSNGKYLYGCQMENNNLMLQKYVSILQRKQMARDRENFRGGE